MYKCLNTKRWFFAMNTQHGFVPARSAGGQKQVLFILLCQYSSIINSITDGRNHEVISIDIDKEQYFHCNNGGGLQSDLQQFSSSINEVKFLSMNDNFSTVSYLFCYLTFDYE
jgi:hypothetical protein